MCLNEPAAGSRKKTSSVIKNGWLNFVEIRQSFLGFLAFVAASKPVSPPTSIFIQIATDINSPLVPLRRFHARDRTSSLSINIILRQKDCDFSFLCLFTSNLPISCALLSWFAIEAKDRLSFILTQEYFTTEISISMALRCSFHQTLPSTCRTIQSASRTLGRNRIAIKAGLKHSNTEVDHGSFIGFPTIRQTPEEIASRFGLDMAILELERLFRKTGHPLPQKHVLIPSDPSSSFELSRKPLRVAYQGSPGSYTQEATIEAFSSSCDTIPCHRMEDAFIALEKRTADRAIIPMENSLDGVIDRNLDLLLRHECVEILDELVVPVNHCLLAFPGSSISHINRIASHPQALSHCRVKVESLSNVEIEEVSNTAEAARYIAENRITDTAVIGSKIAAKEFGLCVLDNNFQDETQNFTRFLQLGLQGPEDTRTEKISTKTMIAFSLKNGASDLFRALWAFESRDVAVRRVEHRPNRSNPIRIMEKESDCFRYIDYVFILEVEGSQRDDSVRRGLGTLKELSGEFVRVLGSY